MNNTIKAITIFGTVNITVGEKTSLYTPHTVEFKPTLFGRIANLNPYEVFVYSEKNIFFRIVTFPALLNRLRVLALSFDYAKFLEGHLMLLQGG